MDQGIVAVVIGVAVKYLLTEIEGVAAGLCGLAVEGPAVFFEPDRIGVTVLILVHGNKPAGDTDTGIAQLVEPGVDIVLAQEFVQPAVCVVVAYEEDLSNVLSDGGQAICRAGICRNGGLSRIGAIGEHRGILVDAIALELVYLFEGKYRQRELYR